MVVDIVLPAVLCSMQWSVRVKKPGEYNKRTGFGSGNGHQSLIGPQISSSSAVDQQSLGVSRSELICS